MTTTSQEGIPGVGTGILLPVFANQFTVKMEVINTNEVKHDDLFLISQQVTKVDLDLINRTVTLTLEQPIGKPMIEMLNRVFQTLTDPTCQTKSNKLTINYMSGQNSTPTSCDLFTNITPVSHNMTLRYENDIKIALHTCVFKYQSVKYSFVKV